MLHERVMSSPAVIAVVLGASLGLGVWLLTVRPPESPPSLATKITRWPVLTRLRGLLEEAGYGHLSPLVVATLASAGALVVGALVAVMIPIPVLAFIAAGATGVGGYGVIAKQRAARQHRLRVAWPGVIDHIRAGIRSGSDISHAITALPDTLPADISGPVHSFRINIERGLGTDTALSELARDLADPVADRVVEVLRMAHDVGGTDLPNVLLSLQHSVRGDIAVREDAHAKQSWIRSAAILAVSAPWVVLVVIGTRGDTASAYQGLEGTLILLAGALVSLVAFRMMRHIGSLPEQRRWLA